MSSVSLVLQYTITLQIIWYIPVPEFLSLLSLIRDFFLKTFCKIILLNKTSFKIISGSYGGPSECFQAAGEGAAHKGELHDRFLAILFEHSQEVPQPKMWQRCHRRPSSHGQSYFKRWIKRSFFFDVILFFSGLII